MSRKHNIATILVGLAVATVGCSKQAPPQPEVQSVRAASPSQAELERVTAENQWLREQLEQEKAKVASLETDMRQAGERIATLEAAGKGTTAAKEESPPPGILVFENDLMSSQVLDHFYCSWGIYGGRARYDPGQGLLVNRVNSHTIVWPKHPSGEKYRVRFETQMTAPGATTWSFAGPGYGNSTETGYCVWLDGPIVRLLREGVEKQRLQLKDPPAENEWFSVEANGDRGHFVAKINDVVVADFTDPEPLTGPLHSWVGLGAGGGRGLLYRNLRIWSADAQSDMERQLTPLANSSDKPVPNGRLLYEFDVAGGRLGDEWWCSQPEHIRFADGALAWPGVNGNPALVLKTPIPKRCAYEVILEYASDEALSFFLMMWYGEQIGTPIKKHPSGWIVTFPDADGTTKVRWISDGSESRGPNLWDVDAFVVGKTSYYAPIGKKEYLMRFESLDGGMRLFVDGGLLLDAQVPAGASIPPTTSGFPSIGQGLCPSKVRAFRVYELPSSQSATPAATVK